MNSSPARASKPILFRARGRVVMLALLAWSGAAHAQSAAAAVQPVPLAAPAPAVDASLGRDGYPLAGYRGGLFYLRDSNDDYRLYLQCRAHLDFYSYAGPGVSDTTLKPTLFLRRARPE